MKTDRIKKVWTFVKSIKVAVVLIVLITVAVTADVLLLAKRWAPDTTTGIGQTGEIHRYWWFQLMVCLLLLNLSACTFDNAFRRLRLRQFKWRQTGSLVFHFGMIIILLGTLLSGSYRVFGTIKLIEGEPKQIPYDVITSRTNHVADDSSKFSIVLRSQKPEFDQWGGIKEVFSKIEVSDNKGYFAGAELAEQEKVTYRGLYMFPSSYGYAVTIETEGPGKTKQSVTVPMDTRNFEGGIKAYSRSVFNFDFIPYTFSFNFYPDLAEEGSKGGSLINKSQVLGNPGLFVNAQEGDKYLIQQVIRQGEIIDLGEYRLVFKNVKPWSELTSVYDPGVPLVFLGITVSLVGLAILAVYSKPRVFE